MNLVFGCIVRQHDLRLVAIAAALCLLACGTALAMILRARAAQGAMRNIWLASAGTVAGAGIWATHFIAMLAYSAGMPIDFDPLLTLCSIVIAIILCAVGFATALAPGGGTRGGIVTGIAISGMHYVGMAAVDVQGEAVWNMQLVAASVLIGVSLTGLAGTCAAHGKTVASYFGAVLLFTLGILGMHFTAMTAVHFVADPARSIPHMVLAPFLLALIVAALAGFVIIQALIVAQVDSYLAGRAQGEARRMRAYIAELEATKDKLEQSSRAAESANKAKSSFLASMSHELRTPLNAVIGFSETMRVETFGPLGSPRYREYLGDIHASGVHLLSIINDILDVSRFDTGHGELQEDTFDPQEVIADTIRMMAPQAGKAQVVLTTNVAPDLPRLNADRRRIRQILLNLISNALKFTPAGGQVSVAAHCTAEAFVMSVQDTGIGIAPGDMAKALEPFGQIDSALSRKYQGTGLGLPLTRQLTELHGGALKLDSILGSGTTVTVSLPPWRCVPAPVAAAA